MLLNQPHLANNQEEYREALSELRVSLFDVDSLVEYMLSNSNESDAEEWRAWWTDVRGELDRLVGIPKLSDAAMAMHVAFDPSNSVREPHR